MPLMKLDTCDKFSCNLAQLDKMVLLVTLCLRTSLFNWPLRTDAEAKALILWPPDVKSQLIRKDPDAGKD